MHLLSGQTHRANNGIFLILIALLFDATEHSRATHFEDVLYNLIARSLSRSAEHASEHKLGLL